MHQQSWKENLAFILLSTSLEFPVFDPFAFLCFSPLLSVYLPYPIMYI